MNFIFQKNFNFFLTAKTAGKWFINGLFNIIDHINQSMLSTFEIFEFHEFCDKISCNLHQIIAFSCLNFLLTIKLSVKTVYIHASNYIT